MILNEEGEGKMLVQMKGVGEGMGIIIKYSNIYL